MTNPIERVYVCESESPLGSSLVTTDSEQAEKFVKLWFLEKPKQRVFTEERGWQSVTLPPNNSRNVLVMCHLRHGRTRVIVALFGSESKWVAEDHDLRRTYLSEGTVTGWRELPEMNEVFT